ncbi:hypothetical protein WOLCODRAFT_64717 [Wolfiporia cocos MD-104 SS10]|uniref:Anaphase-promoting complex subunit 5 n=1 Tax=Wolfiporia cocos (strain MD-104) TaxID=742152 RepID=A0A2H3JEK4_WOLCO|nr:hypothetical protein WOLCODRAFT_64717 [Wolfiporia cocos MD-104 SS10]
MIPAAPLNPTSHVLRPHHIVLLKLMKMTLRWDLHPTSPISPLPPPYLLNIYRILLREIAEVSEPRTYAQILDEISTEIPVAKNLPGEFRTQVNDFSSWQCMDLITTAIPLMYSECEDEEGPRFLFGYFCRRCYVSFMKLSYTGLTRLHHEFLEWTDTTDYQIWKTQADKKQYATSDAYAAYEKGMAVGDEITATENLRRFFEQRFHDGNDSMLHRLPPLERGRKPILNDIQPDLHPLEVLHDVQKLIQIQNQQPLTASFEKIVQAVGLYDHWLDIQKGVFIESEQFGQHAVQSVVWMMQGSERIAQIEENVVTAFTEVGGDDDNRITVTLNRAYYRARQGDYQDAIASLLEPDVWRGLTMNQYNAWANEIWHILVLRAGRRRQERQFAEFLKQRRPHGRYKSREYWPSSSTPIGSIIRDPLYDYIQMREADQAHAWVEPLLTAIWHGEFQCRYGLYRTAAVLLADVGLEFGMTKWCRKTIDEVMPQIIAGNELEQKALACFTLARCIIAAEEASPESLKEAAYYLKIAEQDYAKLEILRSLQDVQYLQSIVFHNLDNIKERDEAAARHLKTDEERKKAAAVVIEDWVVDVWDVVTQVGAALAAR